MRNQSRRLSNRKMPISREYEAGVARYRLNGRLITSRREIERLDALAVPPAWIDVTLSESPRAKVLARGVDAAGRTQTIYHPSFRKRQDRRKFDRMQRFGRALPRLRRRVEKDMRRRRINRDRVTACAIRLIDLQLFRVGNSEYDGIGLTTIRRRHIRVTSTGADYDFRGKSGTRQRGRVRDPRSARLLAQLTALEGPEVFRFIDEDQLVHRLRSRHINAYVKRYMGREFTAKDFRTWGGTVAVVAELLAAEPDQLDSEAAKAATLRRAIKVAAERLGNTPAVTRSSYVDPRVIEAVNDPGRLTTVRRWNPAPAQYLSTAEQKTLKLLRG